MKRLMVLLALLLAVTAVQANDAWMSFGEESVSAGVHGKYVGGEIGMYQEEVLTRSHWGYHATSSLWTAQAVGVAPLTKDKRLIVYGAYGMCKDLGGGSSGCGGAGIRWRFTKSAVVIGGGWDSRRDANIQLGYRW